MNPLLQRAGRFALLLLLSFRATAAPAPQYHPATAEVPRLPREFRGLWIASVKNIDWPSKAGLTTEAQQAELIALLDRAKATRVNAVLLQIRPSCDALYASTIEPWSEYLTGRMGRAPAPYYDPLAFAVEAAHRRGMELHAWVNPYRARHSAAFSEISPDHISKTRPGLAKPYGKSLWLDPGDREVQEHSLRVVMDVVQRYDIDGVHFDDYFYPYQEKDAQGRVLPFPDWTSWKRYKDGGGRLERDDWRRENVNLFVTRVSQSIKATKPWVRFGISPFGIWRPGYPAQIRGLDAYDVLYADARKWLHEGWVDYLAPQLYWNEEKPQTSFNALLGWWLGENPKRRHVWPGLDATKVGRRWEAGEISAQIQSTRREAASDGNILWGARSLAENRGNLADALRTGTFSHPSLTPANPWNDRHLPAPPVIRVNTTAGTGPQLAITPAAGSEPLRFWLVQTQQRGGWTSEVIPAPAQTTVIQLRDLPEVIAVTAVDRSGNTSAPAALSRTNGSAQKGQ